MLLRARIVLPVSQPPIQDGAVRVDGERIISIGRWADFAFSERREVNDLGETILLPGLINAHCHLDYTDMAGRIPAPRHFSDWIKSIMALKAEWSYTEFAQSWLRGARMLLHSGTTTVADVEAVPELLPDIWTATPLRVISFREVISLKKAGAKELVENSARQWAALAAAEGQPAGPEPHAASVLPSTELVKSSHRLGLSPHAPYSTTAELLQAAAETARQRGWRLVTHVAESESEFDMFMSRRGPLYDWLQTQRDMSDCGHGSPVQYLERCGYLSANLAAVHANYLRRDDVEVLARRKVNIVHCPRSHNYFGHRSFPQNELAAAGVNICLGTDSLASSPNTPKQPPELNMFAEMQTLARQRPGLSPAAILRMATINGASALGRNGELGQLSPKAMADIIALPFGGTISEAEEAVVHYNGKVKGTMIGGRWVHGEQ